MKTVLNNQNFELTDTSSIFLKKYLERMKNFIENNSIEIEVYEDIEERIAEILSEIKTKKISDKTIIDIVNEIGEPDEIFSELIRENINTVEHKEDNINDQNFFSNKNRELMRNSEKGIFFGVCYGIASRYNLDPLWVRLVFIFGAFLGGSTLLLYIVLIFLLPNRQEKKGALGDNIIIEKATEIKHSIVNEAKKVGEKLENIDKKDLEDFKNTIVSKAKNLGNKVNINKIKDTFSSSEKQEDSSIPKDENTAEDIVNIKKTVKKKLQVNNYSLQSSSDEIREKIVYREVKPNIIVRLFRFIKNIIKNIFYFIFHSVRIFLAFVIFVSAIPALIAFLFVSGLIFTDIQINNQELFTQIDLFLKIGIVGILFSVFFGIFGIFLKLLSSKTVANIFMINGLIGIFIFIFISGLGFFQTATKFTDTYIQTETFTLDTKELHIQDNDVFNNDKGINWVRNIEFIQTSNEDITIEITSMINRKSQYEADQIFSKLNPIIIEEGNNLDLGLYKNINFSETVPYSFLRKNIKIYIPEDVTLIFDEINGDNINDISNLYYLNNKNKYKQIWWLDQCENSKIIYNTEISGYVCPNVVSQAPNTGIENIVPQDENPQEDIIFDEINNIISEEIENIEEIQK